MTERRLAGVLALQGDVPEHREALASILGKEGVIEVRSPGDLARVGAVVLPGGESTTLSRLLDEAGLRAPLTQRAREGMGILSTCAGLILLARSVEGSPHGRDPVPLRLLDVNVRRNDYGRQAESFEAPVEVQGVSGGEFPAVFIRAPRILEVGREVKVLARYAGSPVMVRQQNLWGLTFHPEIGADRRLHAYFLRESGLWPA